MCGRFTLRTPARDMVEIFELLREPELVPRFNIAPTSQVTVVRQAGKHRELSTMRWGLVPTWSKDPKAGPPLINARAETLATKPAFRSAFKRRRCLIPADGFYEWQKIAGAKVKQPFYIRFAKDRPFAFAGLWEKWHNDEGSTLESCTIVTTEPNDVMRPIHERMPVILPDEEYARWLDPKNEDVEELQPVCGSALHVVQKWGRQTRQTQGGHTRCWRKSKRTPRRPSNNTGRRSPGWKPRRMSPAGPNGRGTDERSVDGRAVVERISEGVKMTDRTKRKRVFLKAASLMLTEVAILASPLIVFAPALISDPTERLSVMAIGSAVVLAIISTSVLLAIALALWNAGSRQP